jgi:hypothetical protein
VAGYYFFRVADGGQVDASVPVLEYIDVRRYALAEGVVGCWSLIVGIAQKRMEQFGYAGGLHCEFRL